MKLHSSISDISSELKIYRHGFGFKLVKPEKYVDHRYDTKHTVKTLLNLPLSVIFLNKDSVIQKLNENNAETCGFDSTHSAIGKTIYDAYQRNAAKFSLQHDLSVLETNSMLIKEEKCERMDDASFHCVTAKFPWYNGINQLVGILGFSFAIGLKNNYELSDALNAFSQLSMISDYNKKPIIPNIINGVALTRREIDCLKYVVNGMSARYIAEKLNLSKRTIESYLGVIKIKLGVQSKSDLIDFLINHVL